MMTKADKIAHFDPSQPGLADAAVFGLPFTAEESEIIIIPVPWEVTVSYGGGTSLGPSAILDASFQVDLFHEEFVGLWKLGLYMDEEPQEWVQKSAEYKLKAQPIISALEKGEVIDEQHALFSTLHSINEVCAQLKRDVQQKAADWMSKGKKVVLLGGDHSTPLGYYEALSTVHPSFGILHLDAHMDLRNAYEGFTYSHASIMYNALQLPAISTIVQVGIRDFCDEEYQVVQAHPEAIHVFTDKHIKANLFEGLSWKEQCDQIIAALPENVCISFDIDVLQAWYCPNTGTPVPGGLSFDQATYLLSRVAQSGKTVIGFDLVEVAPGDDDWDGNVGARMLLHLCGVLAQSQGMLK